MMLMDTKRGFNSLRHPAPSYQLNEQAFAAPLSRSSKDEAAVEVKLHCGREPGHLPKMLWPVLQGVAHGPDECVVGL